LLIQHIINGLLLGGVYATIGIGFSLVYGVMSIINLAHGSLIMLGAYVTYVLFQQFGIDPFVTVPVSFMAMFALGFFIQKYITNCIIKWGLFMTVVLTFGFDLVFINTAMLIWNSNFRGVVPSYSGAGLELGIIVIPYIRLAIFIVSIALTWLLYQFLNHTRTGQAIRATALNREASQLVGVDINIIFAVTFGIGAGFAGAAGGLFSMIFPITPFMGVPFLGKAFAVAVLGGLGNINGAIVGGLVLGLAEALGAAAFGTGFQQGIGFMILLLVLVFRPKGIIGKQFFG